MRRSAFGTPIFQKKNIHLKRFQGNNGLFRNWFLRQKNKRIENVAGTDCDEGGSEVIFHTQTDPYTILKRLAKQCRNR